MSGFEPCWRITLSRSESPRSIMITIHSSSKQDVQRAQIRDPVGVVVLHLWRLMCSLALSDFPSSYTGSGRYRSLGRMEETCSPSQPAVERLKHALNSVSSAECLGKKIRCFTFFYFGGWLQLLSLSLTLDMYLFLLTRDLPSVQFSSCLIAFHGSAVLGEMDGVVFCSGWRRGSERLEWWYRTCLFYSTMLFPMMQNFVCTEIMVLDRLHPHM